MEVNIIVQMEKFDLLYLSDIHRQSWTHNLDARIWIQMLTLRNKTGDTLSDFIIFA